MKRILAVCLVALFVAACASGFGVRTDDTGDVVSICDRSAAEYDGHRLHCARLENQSARPRCPAGDLDEAKAARKKAKEFCDRNPADTPGNRAFILDLVKQQALIGSGQ